MCPFCISTAVWIAAGAVSAGGVSALAVKVWNSTMHKQEVNSDSE